MACLPFQMCNAEQVLAQARKRKRRTSIETNVKGTLESFFRKCVKPSPQEISQIAEDLNLDKDVGWEGSEGGCPNGCGSQMLVSSQVDTVSCGRAAGTGSRHQPGQAQPQQELWQGGGCAGESGCCGDATSSRVYLSHTQCLVLPPSPFPVSPPLQVVRVWFCNRRQKGKRLLLPFGNEAEGVMYDMNQSLVPTGLPIPVTSQGYSLAPSPPVYMPPFHKAEMFPPALQPGLSMNNSSL